jgi:hypothetical protein
MSRQSLPTPHCNWNRESGRASWAISRTFHTIQWKRSPVHVYGKVVYYISRHAETRLLHLHAKAPLPTFVANRAACGSCVTIAMVLPYSPLSFDSSVRALPARRQRPDCRSAHRPGSGPDRSRSRGQWLRAWACRLPLWSSPSAGWESTNSATGAQQPVKSIYGRR